GHARRGRIVEVPGRRRSRAAERRRRLESGSSHARVTAIGHRRSSAVTHLCLRVVLLAAAVVVTSLALGTQARAACVSSVGPGIPPPASVPAGIPGFHAAWWGQSGYMQLCPGDRANAIVAYRDSGSRGWVAGRMGEAAYLGTWGPDPGQDRASSLGGDG